MTEQEMVELKLEMEREIKEEQYEEQLMHRDAEYCLERLGLYDLHDEINKLVNRTNEYGHCVSFNEVIEMIKDI